MISRWGKWGVWSQLPLNMPHSQYQRAMLPEREIWLAYHEWRHSDPMPAVSHQHNGETVLLSGPGTAAPCLNTVVKVKALLAWQTQATQLQQNVFEHIKALTSGDLFSTTDSVELQKSQPVCNSKTTYGEEGDWVKCWPSWQWMPSIHLKQNIHAPCLSP